MRLLLPLQWLGDDEYLKAAEALHSWCFARGTEGAGSCGGITWKACGEREGSCAADGCTKNSVTLLEVLIGSAKLAALVPDKPAYRRAAISLWHWFETLDLFNDDGLVADGATGPSSQPSCCNATASPKCHNNRGLGYSYNQG